MIYVQYFPQMRPAHLAVRQRILPPGRDVAKRGPLNAGISYSPVMSRRRPSRAAA